ncbi:hypothetical protein HDU97_009523 [Phlyctochytrium planicorne]|nr:hypothetical protein HDU97_009523 [Phlyctochytrium planicorne]
MLNLRHLLTLCSIGVLLSSIPAAAAAANNPSSAESIPKTLSLRHIFRIGYPSHQDLTSSAPPKPYFERTDFHPNPLHPSNLKTVWTPDADLVESIPSALWAQAAGARHAREETSRMTDSMKQKVLAKVLPPPNFFKDARIAAKPASVPQWFAFSTRALQTRAAADRLKSKVAANKAYTREELEEIESLEWWENILNSSKRNVTGPSDPTLRFTVKDAQGEDVNVAHKSYMVPDDRNTETVLTLGRMAYNAYYEPGNREWVEVPGWGASDGFGTKGSGIRGYIYASESSDVIVIVIKGTSLQTPFTGGPSSANDKLNDNKMFSCCCGKAGWSWTPVCGCADRSATTCDTGCVRREMDFRESYYRLATSITHTVEQLFPSSSIWMTGHSLGGALASLVALTFDIPAFTYETPGDLLFARRLGLLPPLPPVPDVPIEKARSSKQQIMDALEDDGDKEEEVYRDGDLTPYVPFLETLNIYQFGNDGDPIYLGDCRSVTSSCWFGGYAIETRCHVGKECLYEQDRDGKPIPPGPIPPDDDSSPPSNFTSGDEISTTKSSSVYNHGIQHVIDRYLIPWEYVPGCKKTAKKSMSAIRTYIPRAAASLTPRSRVATIASRSIATALCRPTVFKAVAAPSNLRSILPCNPSFALAPLARAYSGHAEPLTIEKIEKRVMELLSDFEKVDVAKLTLDAHFINDLGLDSLDQVEITMALEDEFNIEIPDRDADDIFTPRKAIEKMSSGDPPTYARAIYIPPSDQWELPSAVAPRIVELLKASLPFGNVQDLRNLGNATPDEVIKSVEGDAKTLIFSVGLNEVTEKLISPSELTALSSEGFIVRSKSFGKNGAGATLVAVLGNQWIDKPHPDSDLTPREWLHGNRGLAYGVYAALEELGFAFLHPFAPSIPPEIKRISPTSQIDLKESPRWSQFRAIHYHTQHPLELTNFLQGWGDESASDENGWESHVVEWERCCEWLLANRQNGFEWAMLESDKWESGSFSRSDMRLQRFQRIVEIGHNYSLAIGVDVPIAFAQQHSFRLLKSSGKNMNKLEEEKAEIRESLDWVMDAGFDFLGTENGTSEFTHVSPQHMLHWMDCAADHAAKKYNKPMHMKIHCSSGQVAKGFVDERTGDDINYNMLPHYATANLGVLPHTVETYALDDRKYFVFENVLLTIISYATAAPTYGNKDFVYMRDFIKWQLKSDNRSVVFYPETAYWVSFDIDLPLFLPIYAERRVHDLRLIASDEDSLAAELKASEPAQPPKKMDGQLIFSSGWEWGYWMNDVIAGRAAWDPKASAPDSREAFIQSVYPVTRHLGSAQLQKTAAELLADWVAVQRGLLILGKTDPSKEGPKDVHRRNGHAYLEGWDTWDDVSKLLGKLTQPDRLSLIEMRHEETWFGWVWKFFSKAPENPVDYEKEVAPLLKAMDENFAFLADRTEALAAQVPAYLRDLWDDLADAGRMTALRAKHVRLLYEYVYSVKKGSASIFGSKLGDREKAKAAVAVVREAHVVVARREAKYRVPAKRIASWTNLHTTNPTAYPFNYLWTVHSLHLWWRDTAQALIPNFSVHKSSFCNIIDPIEVGLGDGRALHTAESVAAILSRFGFGKDYFALSLKEPHYPQDIPHWSEP